MREWVEENGGFWAVLFLALVFAVLIISLCACIDFESEAWYQFWHREW